MELFRIRHLDYEHSICTKAPTRPAILCVATGHDTSSEDGTSGQPTSGSTPVQEIEPNLNVLLRHGLLYRIHSDLDALSGRTRLINTQHHCGLNSTGSYELGTHVSGPYKAGNMLTHRNTIGFSKTPLFDVVDSGVIIASLNLIALLRRNFAVSLYHLTAFPSALVLYNGNKVGVGV